MHDDTHPHAHGMDDIVLWHTFGLTHVPRSDDWPIVPVGCTGF